MGDEPFVISHLIRVAIQNDTISALERVLAQGVADDLALRKMQDLLELEMKESTWLHALRGERAGVHVCFDDLRTGALPMNTLNGFGSMGGITQPRTISEWISDQFPSSVLKYYPDHLSHMTRLIEIGKLPMHEQRPKVLAWEQSNKTSGNRITLALAPSVEKVHLAERRSQANLRTAVVALACERYRLQRGDWPAALEDVVKAGFLAELPIDPVDGNALRHVRDKDKITIYSIGNNENDDGGVIDRTVADTGPVDLGFRLWHPQKRRAP